MPPEVLAQREFLIGPSGATSLLDAFAEVLAPGIVLTSDPLYYIYCNALERKGFTILAVPEDKDGVCPEALEAALAALGVRQREIAFFYFVTVNNPSCTILSNDRRLRLLEIASHLSQRQKRPIPLLLDQAYEFLIHNPDQPAPISPMPADTLGILYELGTLSKVLAPALRIGYLLASPSPLFDALVQKTSDVGFSAPLLNQEIAALLLDHQITAQLRFVQHGYREKGQAVREMLDASFGEALEECRGGNAGFYYYLTFREIATHPESPFFRFLTRTTGQPEIDGPPEAPYPRVIYIPGVYCVHPQGACVELGKRQLRLSYGYESLETIRRAIELMREALDYAPAHSRTPIKRLISQMLGFV